MKLYVTFTSPCARIARIVVAEKGLADRVEIVEARARSMCEGICVWVREMRRPENERSPTNQAHEAARSERMADYFEAEMAQPLLQGTPNSRGQRPRTARPGQALAWHGVNMAQLVLLAGIDFARTGGLGDLTAGRPELAAWHARLSALPSAQATAAPGSVPRPRLV